MDTGCIHSRSGGPSTIPKVVLRLFLFSRMLEEEGYGMLKAGHYCSINIDDVYSSYRVLGKLGYGSTSTVWLARNIRYGGYHVLLKIFARGTTTGPARGKSERTRGLRE